MKEKLLRIPLGISGEDIFLLLLLETQIITCITYGGKLIFITDYHAPKFSPQMCLS